MSKKLLNPNRTILILAITGILLCIYLWSIQIKPIQAGDTLIPCTPNGGCAQVLTSPISKIFGVPMAVYGFFFYAAVLGVTVQREIIAHRLLTQILLGLIIWGDLFTVYLRYLELSKIGHLCVWCWVSVLIIVLMNLTLAYELNLIKRIKRRLQK